MLKTDYIKAFTKAIEEADFENETVVRNLKNALVMASARYEGDSCTNIQIVTATCQDDVNPWWQFASADYRLKPEPQYLPFDYESIKPHIGRIIKGLRDKRITILMSASIAYCLLYHEATNSYTRVMYNTLLTDYLFFSNGKPAGVEV